MFDPTVGRWMTLDPIGFDAGDPNLYRYVGNNPTTGTDPSGLEDKNILKPVVEVMFFIPSLVGKAIAPEETGHFIQGFEDRTRGVMELHPVVDVALRVAEGKPLFPEPPPKKTGNVGVALLKAWSDYSLAPFIESGNDTAAAWTAVTTGDCRPLAYRGGARTFDGSMLAATEGVTSGFPAPQRPIPAKVVNIGGPLQYGETIESTATGPLGNQVKTTVYNNVNPRFQRKDFVDINMQGKTAEGTTLEVDFNSTPLTEQIKPGVRFLRGSNVPVAPVDSGIWVRPEAVVQQAECLGVRNIAISTGKPTILADKLTEAGWTVRIRRFSIEGIEDEKWNVVTATRPKAGK